MQNIQYVALWQTNQEKFLFQLTANKSQKVN